MTLSGAVRLRHTLALGLNDCGEREGFWRTSVLIAQLDKQIARTAASVETGDRVVSDLLAELDRHRRMFPGSKGDERVEVEELVTGLLEQIDIVGSTAEI